MDAGGQGIMLVFEGMKQVFDGGEIVAGAEVAAKPKLDSSAAGKGVFTDDLMKVEDIKTATAPNSWSIRIPEQASPACAPSWNPTATLLL